MPETWIDDALGSGFFPDERFTSRLETTLREEWHTETPVVPLTSTSTGVDLTDSPDAASDPTRRTLLAAAAALLLIAGGIVAWQVTAGDEPSPATNPPTTTGPESTPSSTVPVGTSTVVEAEGGSSLGIENESLFQSRGVDPTNVTSWGDTFVILQEPSRGEYELVYDTVGTDDPPRSIPIELPTIGDGEPTGLYADDTGSIYLAWTRETGAGAIASTVARVEFTEGPARVVERQTIRTDRLPHIVADDRGVVVDGSVVLDRPGPSTVARPGVGILDGDGDDWTPEDPSTPLSDGPRRPPEDVTVQWTATEDATRQWALRFESPATGHAILDLAAHVIPDSRDVVVLETFQQQGELRTNVVRLHEDGSVSSSFVRGWFVTDVTATGLMLTGLHPNGVLLATAPLPA